MDNDWAEHFSSKPMAQPQVDFPYGKKRNWELENADADLGLKSIAESCVISQSLRQSREKWLLHTFPKFSSKARGAKAPEPPPPHTLMSKGKCNLLVGPHQFLDTLFYQVHYMQPSSTAGALQTSPTPTVTTATTPYSSYYANQSSPAPATPPTTTAAASGSSEDQDQSQLKLGLGGGMEYTISSDLVARIHHEASVNPIFATKFRLALEPNASQEQIRNFAFALPHLPGVRVSGVPTSLTLSTEHARLPPVREWDLVIEFNEAPSDRWLIPRGTLASCTRLVNKGGSTLPDVSLTLRLPLPDTRPNPPGGEEAGTDNKSSDSTPPHPVKFTLRQVPNAIYDLILNWIGGDDRNRENAAALAKIPKRQKVYLPHRLTQGALLSQLQAAQAPSYTMKPLKQGPSNPPRPRRKPVRKPKPVPQETPGAPATPEVPSGAASAPVEKPSKPPKEPKEPKEPKRRRYPSTTKAAPAPIRCLVCFKTDVPLMMGGRYCRECVDGGKADTAIPQLPFRASQTPYAFGTPSAAVSPAVTPVATSTSQLPSGTPMATSTVLTPLPTAVSSTPAPQPVPNSPPSQTTSESAMITSGAAP